MARQADCDAAQANVQASEQGVAAAQKNLESAQANQPGDLTSARAQVNQARLALDRAREDRARIELAAPFDGVVGDVNVVPGVRVAPGSPVLTLVKTRPLRFATTNLGERNVGDIEPGAPAMVTLTTFPDQPLKGTVQRVAPQAATDESGLTTFAVYVDLDPTDLPLRAGMTGRVEIEVGQP
jgi:RND family efflux transporter MFP subunit